jgi:putative endonuclease
MGGREDEVASSVEVGRRGEQVAVRYLKSRGYRILERNYRWNRAEIDVIALDGEVLVFVEVKTRGGEEFGTPARAVDRRKQNQIARVAAHYLQERRLGGTDCRFDVLALMEAPESGKLEINHIENAFWISRTYVV